MNRKFRLVFMGTPDFAVPALKALDDRGHDILLIITQPDKPKGRGRPLSSPPVKEAALRRGYEVLQPQTMKSDDLLARIERLCPDLFVVVAFGHILPKRLLQIPTFGAINIHASLLPKYRGAAPIQWAIINGELETGVTTMLMDEGMDTGNILLTEKVAIARDDTAGTLHDRLAVLGSKLILQTLDNLDHIQPTPQDHAQATYAPMLKKDDGRIPWKNSAESIESLIRGVTPWPGAFTFYGTHRLKIFKAKPIEITVSERPGTIIRSSSEELVIATGNKALSIIEIQGASGKRMGIKEFLRGYRLAEKTVLQ